MTCFVPHTYDEIKSMVEKQIQEDRGRQLALMNLGHEFDDAIIAKDELRKAYEECRDIPLEQRVLIADFLKIESKLDNQMQNALFKKAAKMENKIRDKLDNIPFDLQLDIMNRLPVKSLLQFCIVSKQWKFSIDNFDFIRKYVSTLSSRTWYNLDYDCLPRQSIRIKRSGQAVIDGKKIWIGTERFYGDDGISYKIYMLVSFDLVSHQFHVIDMPEQVGVGDFSPPYYISQLGESLIISGSFDFGDCRVIYAWALEVEGGSVS
ncbi:F-box domain containing protein [Tanacetum coccineum]